MGLITSALQIGRSALLAYQSALQVVGNNVSNAGSPGYTRQTPVLTPVSGTRFDGVSPGAGVMLSALKRNIDEALENRIRYSLGDQSNALARQQALSQIESILNELSDQDLSSRMQAFFNAFGALQNQPQDGGARGVVLTAGDSLVQEISRQRTAVLSLRDQLNANIKADAQQADKLTRGIAELNTQIVRLEAASPGSAGALRDQRDDLLRQLSQLMPIQVREQPNGSVNVYVGNEPLIQDGINRGITSTLEIINGQPKTVVRFANNNEPVDLDGGGEMAGLVTARDTNVLGYLDSLNGLASTLIREVNKVHAQGQGLEGMTTATGTYDVLDPAAALNSANSGPPFAPQNGSFQITVRDKISGASVTTTIQVDLDGIGADDSLNSLVAQINGKVGNLTAGVTPDNRLQLTAGDGFEFTLGQDSSNVLAALGVNTFFTGSDAQDIAVSQVLKGNPDLLAAATSPAEGDGSNAGALAALATQSLAGLRGMSLTDYYNAIATGVGVTSAAAQDRVDVTAAVGQSLSSQRESISGVSLDEETVSMLQLERAFQGAARYTSTVDQMIQEMLQLVR
jgi:flagellar hook-associated protein 1 FlgK